MKYDTVLFDADGTLLDFSRSEREALSEALGEMGIAHVTVEVETPDELCGQPQCDLTQIPTCQTR